MFHNYEYCDIRQERDIMKVKEQKKQKRWMLLRHKIITAIGVPIVGAYTRLKYGIDVQRFRQQGKRPYLILYNHQTGFDQFFVAMAFRGPVYYMASEDIFSMGWVSDLIRFLAAPIPIKKQTTDIQAVMNCIRVAREGGTIAIAPEGNRTFSGRTVYINPAIGSLAKKLGLPIALFRIEDGYGVQPRWSDVVRKGKMRAYVSRVIEPEEYKDKTPDALVSMIREGLEVNEAQVTGKFHHKNLAEYLERVLYVCPDCGLASFETSGDLITCKSCGKQVRYLPTKELEGVNCQVPFRFLLDWYDYQCDFVNNLDTAQLTEEPLFRDTAQLSEVIVYKHKNVLRQEAAVSLYGDRVVIDEGSENALVFPFADTHAFTVLGKNKLNIYSGKDVLQLKGDKRFNALKYVNLFHRFRNISKGDTYGKFLGL